MSAGSVPAQGPQQNSGRNEAGPSNQSAHAQSMMSLNNGLNSVPESTSKQTVILVVVIGASAVTLLVLVVLIIVAVKRRRKRRQMEDFNATSRFDIKEERESSKPKWWNVIHLSGKMLPSLPQGSFDVDKASTNITVVDIQPPVAGTGGENAGFSVTNEFGSHINPIPNLGPPMSQAGGVWSPQRSNPRSPSKSSAISSPRCQFSPLGSSLVDSDDQGDNEIPISPLPAAIKGNNSIPTYLENRKSVPLSGADLSDKRVRADSNADLLKTKFQGWDSTVQSVASPQNLPADGNLDLDGFEKPTTPPPFL